MIDDERLENLAMLIIANAGAARTCAFEALAAAKKEDFAQAAQKKKKSEEYLHEAHSAHSQLLQLDAKGEIERVDLLLAHAQDHLMNAALAQELIAEIIGLYEFINKEEVKEQ